MGVKKPTKSAIEQIADLRKSAQSKTALPEKGKPITVDQFLAAKGQVDQSKINKLARQAQIAGDASYADAKALGNVANQGEAANLKKPITAGVNGSPPPQQAGTITNKKALADLDKIIGGGLGVNNINRLSKIYNIKESDAAAYVQKAAQARIDALLKSGKADDAKQAEKLKKFYGGILSGSQESPNAGAAPTIGKKNVNISLPPKPISQTGSVTEGQSANNAIADNGSPSTTKIENQVAQTGSLNTEQTDINGISADTETDSVAGITLPTVSDTVENSPYAEEAAILQQQTKDITGLTKEQLDIQNKLREQKISEEQAKLTKQGNLTPEESANITRDFQTQKKLLESQKNEETSLLENAQAESNAAYDELISEAKAQNTLQEEKLNKLAGMLGISGDLSAYTGIQNVIDAGEETVAKYEKQKITASKEFSIRIQGVKEKYNTEIANTVDSMNAALQERKTDLLNNIEELKLTDQLEDNKGVMAVWDLIRGATTDMLNIKKNAVDYMNYQNEQLASALEKEAAYEKSSRTADIDQSKFLGYYVNENGEPMFTDAQGNPVALPPEYDVQQVAIDEKTGTAKAILFDPRSGSFKVQDLGRIKSPKASGGGGSASYSRYGSGGAPKSNTNKTQDNESFLGKVGRLGLFGAAVDEIKDTFFNEGESTQNQDPIAAWKGGQEVDDNALYDALDLRYVSLTGTDKTDDKNFYQYLNNGDYAKAISFLDTRYKTYAAEEKDASETGLSRERLLQDADYLVNTYGAEGVSAEEILDLIRHDGYKYNVPLNEQVRILNQYL